MSKEKASTKTLDLLGRLKILRNNLGELAKKKQTYNNVIVARQAETLYDDVEGLVAELQKQIDQAKEDLNSPNFNWDEKSELKGKLKACTKVLEALQGSKGYSAKL